MTREYPCAFFCHAQHHRCRQLPNVIAHSCRHPTATTWWVLRVLRGWFYWRCPPMCHTLALTSRLSPHPAQSLKPQVEEPIDGWMSWRKATAQNGQDCESTRAKAPVTPRRCLPPECFAEAARAPVTPKISPPYSETSLLGCPMLAARPVCLGAPGVPVPSALVLHDTSFLACLAPRSRTVWQDCATCKKKLETRRHVKPLKKCQMIRTRQET